MKKILILGLLLLVGCAREPVKEAAMNPDYYGTATSLSAYEIPEEFPNPKAKDSGDGHGIILEFLMGNLTTGSDPAEGKITFVLDDATPPELFRKEVWVQNVSTTPFNGRRLIACYTAGEPLPILLPDETPRDLLLAPGETRKFIPPADLNLPPGEYFCFVRVGRTDAELLAIKEPNGYSGI